MLGSLRVWVIQLEGKASVEDNFEHHDARIPKNRAAKSTLPGMVTSLGAHVKQK